MSHVVLRKIFVVFVNLCSNYYFADASAENANVMESDLRSPRGCDDDTNANATYINAEMRQLAGIVNDTAVLQVRYNPPLYFRSYIYVAVNPSD